MNQSDAQNMQSYPSPNAGAVDGGGPFYQHQPSPNQPSQSLPNPDHLQLTAHLSRELAPNMTSTGGNAPDGQDQRPQGTVNHQHALPQQSYEQHMQSPQVPMAQMGGQYGAPEDNNMIPRKRSKVSRACDECRRKKIRCDAVGDENAPGTQCTSCKRINTACQFSRVPMKRGPSKGYIKELADRVHSLESRVEGEAPVNASPHASYLPHHQGPSQRPESEEYASSPTMDNSMSRKRTHSISGDFTTTFPPQRSGWSSQDPQRHQGDPFQSPHRGFRELDESPNGLRPQVQWKSPPAHLQQQSSSYDSAVPLDQGSADWDENVVSGYYGLIHLTYPILAKVEENLRSRVANCPAALKSAFYESLAAAVSSCTNLLEYRSTRHAAQLILASQFEKVSTRDASTNLVYLQTIILLAIDADNQASAAAEGYSGPTYSALLGTAVGLAYSMKLHLRKTISDNETDLESDENNLARRIWWSLVMMDRWHSISRSTPVLIPESSVALLPEDIVVLGDKTYQLARISVVVGHFSAALIAQPVTTSLNSTTLPLYATLLRGELDRYREGLPIWFIDPQNAPLIHLVYSYLQIQLHAILPDFEPSDVLRPAVQVVTELVRNWNLRSPLIQHAATLAAATLIELRSYSETRSDAERNLKTLLETRTMASAWDQSIKDMIIKNQRSDPFGGSSKAAESALTASQSLQHLAELATASTAEAEGSDQPADKEPRRLRGLQALVREGYLSKLGG